MNFNLKNLLQARMTQFFGVVRSVFLTIAGTCIFFENIAYVAKVEGVSMQPTLNDISDPIDTRKDTSFIRGYLNRINSSDLVVLSHWSTRNYDIRRGDIVSLISPRNPKQLIIKRVIGVEGKFLHLIVYHFSLCLLCFFYIGERDHGRKRGKVREHLFLLNEKKKNEI